LQKGDNRAALAKFNEAFALVQSPKIMFNMGKAYRALGNDVEARGDPGTGWTLEGEQGPWAACTRHRPQGVGQRGRSDRRRLVRRARGCEARLGHPGKGGLPDHDQAGRTSAARAVPHRSSRCMSRAARMVPSTVPDTFERPARGR